MYRCPECDQKVDTSQINIEEGFALCNECGQLSRLSELRESAKSHDEVLAVAPRGCDFTPSAHSLTLRVSQRSVIGFFGATAIAMFWNGITSLFVLCAIGGIYNNLIGPLPDWFPVPGTNEDGLVEMNDAPMGPGACILLTLFLTPFVCIGVGMIGAMAHSLLGYTEVHLAERDSYVANAIGWFKWRRRFAANQVESIREVKCLSDSDSPPNQSISITADRTIEFGSSLPKERRLWLQTALCDLLILRERSNSSLPQLPWLRSK